MKDCLLLLFCCLSQNGKPIKSCDSERVTNLDSSFKNNKVTPGSKQVTPQRVIDSSRRRSSMVNVNPQGI